MSFEERMMETTGYLKFYELVHMVNYIDIWDKAKIRRYTDSLRIEWNLGSYFPYIDVAFGKDDARFVNGDEVFYFNVDNETHIAFVTDKLQTIEAISRA